MITIRNLGFTYGKKDVLEKYVLRNIDMKLEEGRIYGLLGENGVGKTTLLTLLCGLKKPQIGSIDTDGHIPYDRKPSFLSDQYYLSDEVAAVNMKAIDYAMTYGKFWEGFDIGKFEEIMNIFENDPQQKMTKMSFGQLKKAYIAFALACNTKYIFMDEPTNGLDIPSKAQFRKAVTKYTREDSVILISTHQVRDLENIIDPIIILDKQEVLLNATIEEKTQELEMELRDLRYELHSISHSEPDDPYSRAHDRWAERQKLIERHMEEVEVEIDEMKEAIRNGTYEENEF